MTVRNMHTHSSKEKKQHANWNREQIDFRSCELGFQDISPSSLHNQLSFPNAHKYLKK